MDNIKIAVAQFEPKSGDKEYNLSIIEKLTAEASEKGVDAISFHELSITGYTFFKEMEESKITEYAEEVPSGESCQTLKQLAQKYDIHILAGLVENDNHELYNTYVCIDESGLVSKYRKIHPFINSNLSAGSQYVTFDLKGWTCGILICYDNNIIENVRATTLLGADIIFAPHVTGCTPSPMPGRDYVEDELWENRKENPVPLRLEFDGRKGREWLLKWLPARAYDNGVYYAFTNPIGYDGDQLKNGNSMLLDPFGDIVEEIRSFEDKMTFANLTPEKLEQAGGYRYRNARKPELYREILGQENQGETNPEWLEEQE